MPGGTVKPPDLLHIKLLNSSWITLSRELKMLSGQMLNKCQHFGLINLIIPGKVIGHPSFYQPFAYEPSSIRQSKICFPCLSRLKLKGK